MNFFQQQDVARRNTVWLLTLMAMAVVSLVMMTMLAVSVFLFIGQTAGVGASVPASFWDGVALHLQSGLLLWIGLGTLLVIVAGSFFKYVQLGGSGVKVAQALGGKPVQAETQVVEERRLLNVVEEMAIASGNPVPRVFLLEDDAINAFAAGTDRRDAVIGVTRGCITRLNRDELQGVIAHEFSHIHFGDMRLNLHLVTVLHGILAIGLLGELLLRSGRGRRQKNANAYLSLGAALLAIGYCGIFFGNLIKAAVSRQREFLADAAAVQFTRNPEGIAGALKKIGGCRSGSRLSTPHAAQYSHFYFGQGVRSAFLAWFNTHPPLEVRIRRVQPRWNGVFLTTDSATDTSLSGAAAGVLAAGAVSGFAARGAGLAVAERTEVVAGPALASIGNPEPKHLSYAHRLLENLPQDIKQAAHRPADAMALILGLTLDHVQPAPQLALLHEQAAAPLAEAVERLLPSLAGLHRRDYLPLVELAAPALQQLSDGDYQVLKRNMLLLIQADQAVSLFEWCLFRSVTLSVQPRVASVNKKLAHLMPQVAQLLAAVCAAGGTDSERAFASVRSLLPGLPPVPENAGVLSLAALDRALGALAKLQPLDKPRLLKAVICCIEIDGRVCENEAELFRVVADSLNCPVPPLLGWTA